MATNAPKPIKTGNYEGSEPFQGADVKSVNTTDNQQMLDDKAVGTGSDRS